MTVVYKMKILFLIPFFLGGCVSNEPPRSVESFHGAPISLSVAGVEVVNAFGGYGDESASTSLEEILAKAVENWARPLFVTQGTQGKFFLTIENVSFKRNALTKATQGVTGFFTKDQEEKLSASVTLHMEFRDDKGQMVRTGVVNTAKETTLPEGLTLNQKDARVQEFIQGVLKDLDEQLRAALEENLQEITVTEL